jgi:hypothetical protein
LLFSSKAPGARPLISGVRPIMSPILRFSLFAFAAAVTAAISGCADTPDDKRFYSVRISVRNGSRQPTQDLRVDYSNLRLPISDYNSTVHALGEGYGDDMTIPVTAQVHWRTERLNLDSQVPIRKALRHAAQFRGVVAFFINDDSLAVAAWDCSSTDQRPYLIYVSKRGKLVPAASSGLVAAAIDARKSLQFVSCIST